MIDPSLLEDFYEHRIELKKPMSDRAKTMLVRNLERAESEGHSIELLLENAIIGGWHTVYPNETTKRKQNRKTSEVDFIELHTDRNWALRVIK